MHTEPLPYALEPLRFPFPALAALAGRLPLGGGREVALAALMTARLAQGVSSGDALHPAGAADDWSVDEAAYRNLLAEVGAAPTYVAPSLRW